MPWVVGAGSTPGWGKSGKRFHLSQIRAPSHTGFDDVRPCRSDLGAQTALNKRRLCVKTRREKLFALKQEVVRRGQLLRHERSPSSSPVKSSSQVARLPATFVPYISVVFKATHMSSPTCMLTHSCMSDTPSVMRLVVCRQMIWS